MIARNLTLRDRHLANPWVERLPGAATEAFWRRVRRGFYRAVGLFEGGRCEGILVASVDEREHGRELWLQLSTRPLFARQNRAALRLLVDALAEQHQCPRIVFESKRKGWEAVAESLGFAAEPVTRYTLEVPHGR
jgi:hypothetical protein